MTARNYGIVDYLLVELGNVVVSLPLGLDVDGMALNTFSCRHDWLRTHETSSGCASNRKI